VEIRKTAFLQAADRVLRHQVLRLQGLDLLRQLTVAGPERLTLPQACFRMSACWGRFNESVSAIIYGLPQLKFFAS
jgi:hypothetical protein